MLNSNSLNAIMSTSSCNIKWWHKYVHFERNMFRISQGFMSQIGDSGLPAWASQQSQMCISSFFLNTRCASIARPWFTDISCIYNMEWPHINLVSTKKPSELTLWLDVPYFHQKNPKKKWQNWLTLIHGGLVHSPFSLGIFGNYYSGVDRPTFSINHLCAAEGMCMISSW